MLQLQRKSLIQIHQFEMAGVESAKKALWALLKNFNAGRTSKLTVSTAKGKLIVNLEESFSQHSNVLAKCKTPVKKLTRATPSRLRRKERRAADPAVRKRAAEHAAAAEVSAGTIISSEASAGALPSPERERSSCLNTSLETTPSKEEVREEIVEEEVERIPLKERFKDSIPDFEEVQKIQNIMGETNQCCLCDFNCSVEKQKKGRLFGVLEPLWNHIEEHHPMEFDGWFA